MTRKNTNAKRNTQSRETPTIVLKTIFDDIMKSNPSSTLTTKKMRAKLRVEMRDVHERNATWIFTQSQYDVVRSMFDATHAQRIARASKRNAKTRAPKRDAQSNDAPNDANATTE